MRQHCKTTRFTSTLLLSLGLVVAVALSGPAWAQPVPKADFVFIIDATPSMGGEITAVKNGMSSFVTGLEAEDIDARFAIVLFGGEPELVLDFTDDPVATTAALGLINVSGGVPGFQNPHNVNPEAGLEAIRTTLGAGCEPLNTDNVGGDGVLVFRPDAVKDLILITDEDGDRPFHGCNQLPGQTGNEPQNPPMGDWQIEIDNTAAACIDQSALVNMLVNPGDSPTTFQYGDPASDVSDPDFLNYDPEATLLALQAAGFGDSLQAQLLEADVIGRTFNITQVDQPNFIDNFFAAKVEEVGNIPPMFVNTPDGTCVPGFELQAVADVPFVFNVIASDIDVEQTVTLTADAGGLANFSCDFTPGNPAMAECTFTPDQTQVGIHTITFTATDDGSPNLSSTLDICINVSECYLLVSLAPAAAGTFEIGSNTFPTQLGDVLAWFPVTMEDGPAFPLFANASENLSVTGLAASGAPLLGSVEFAVQVVMWNPTLFPRNPSQWSQSLCVLVLSDGRVTTRRFGNANGIQVDVATSVNRKGSFVEFPFTIDGF